MKVDRIELPESLTVDSAYEFVGRIAAVCTGAKVDDMAKNVKRGKRNRTEAFGGTPTRAYEFLAFNESHDIYTPEHCRNFRTRLKSGNISLKELCLSYNKIRDRVDNFHIFKITAPRYIVAHIKTHTTLSSLTGSRRIGCNCEPQYEFPPVEKGGVVSTNYFNDNAGGWFYDNRTHKQFAIDLQDNYNRKEINKRPLSDFELLDVHICGYEDAWRWFIDQRTEKGVQKETIELAKMIDELIKE